MSFENGLFQNGRRRPCALCEQKTDDLALPRAGSVLDRSCAGSITRIEFPAAPEQQLDHRHVTVRSRFAKGSGAGTGIFYVYPSTLLHK